MNFMYEKGAERMLSAPWPLYGETFETYTWISVKRRTWRTLWLVPRTFRVKVPTIKVSLSTDSYVV